MTTPARFTFRLQRVLEMRERHEEAAQLRLAAEAAEADAARAMVSELAAVRAAGADALTAAQATPTSVGHLRAFAFAIEQMDVRLAMAGEEASAANERVTAAQGALVEAFQARHAISRLRERAHEAWRIDSTAAEQRQMDELALSRHMRPNALAVNE